MYKAVLSMTFTDGLSALYHASVARERSRGDSLALTEKWMGMFENGTIPLTRRSIAASLRQAVAEFNALNTHKERLPKVAVVGEIYVKYNTFVNNDIVQWLIDQEMEVVLPPLLNFFLGSFVAQKVGVISHLRRRDLLWGASGLSQRVVRPILAEAEAILHGYRYYPGHSTIFSIADTASAAVELTHQYGESWLLAGEIGELSKAEVKNVLCLQPFGCLANQVTAKGVSRRLKKLYPELNLLFLDLDAGGSEVNLINRAHFFVEQAKAVA